jgi:multicomponent Na+:H+ antiporter subunit A
VVIGTMVLLGGATLLRSPGSATPLPPLHIQVHEMAVVLAMAAAAVVAVLLRSRMAAILATGVVGYGLALLFAFFSAPDLAMTQVAVETLIVVIFVLIVHRLPLFSDYSPWRSRVRDALFAVVAGGFMAVLTLVMALAEGGESISSYFAENSLLRAYGRNVVNVILVDFRALDTLGEITVLAIAALGVAALLRAGSRDAAADDQQSPGGGSTS